MPIGRDAEAARISTFLRDVPGGPRVLLIEGKAGIEKTTLLRKGHDTAVQLEITVLSPYPVESEVPLEFAGLPGNALDHLGRLPGERTDVKNHDYN
jgi:predicted ATPase